MKAKTVEIIVTKTSAYLKVRTEASYLAGKDVYNKSKESYDRISIADADSLMLDKLWDKTTSVLLGAVRKYVGEVNSTSSQFDVVLNMPLSFSDTKYNVPLNTIAEQYVVNDLLAKWLPIANDNDDAVVYANLSADKLLELRTMLSEREIPVREDSEIKRIPQDTVIVVEG